MIRWKASSDKLGAILRGADDDFTGQPTVKGKWKVVDGTKAILGNNTGRVMPRVSKPVTTTIRREVQFRKFTEATTNSQQQNNTPHVNASKNKTTKVVTKRTNAAQWSSTGNVRSHSKENTDCFDYLREENCNESVENPSSPPPGGAWGTVLSLCQSTHGSDDNNIAHFQKTVPPRLRLKDDCFGGIVMRSTEDESSKWFELDLKKPGFASNIHGGDGDGNSSQGDVVEVKTATTTETNDSNTTTTTTTTTTSSSFSGTIVLISTLPVDSSGRKDSITAHTISDLKTSVKVNSSITGDVEKRRLVSTIDIDRKGTGVPGMKLRKMRVLPNITIPIFCTVMSPISTGLISSGGTGRVIKYGLEICDSNRNSNTPPYLVSPSGSLGWEPRIISITTGNERIDGGGLHSVFDRSVGSLKISLRKRTRIPSLSAITTTAAAADGNENENENENGNGNENDDCKKTNQHWYILGSSTTAPHSDAAPSLYFLPPEKSVSKKSSYLIYETVGLFRHVVACSKSAVNGFAIGNWRVLSHPNGVQHAYLPRLSVNNLSDYHDDSCIVDENQLVLRELEVGFGNGYQKEATLHSNSDPHGNVAFKVPIRLIKFLESALHGKAGTAISSRCTVLHVPRSSCHPHLPTISCGCLNGPGHAFDPSSSASTVGLYAFNESIFGVMGFRDSKSLVCSPLNPTLGGRWGEFLPKLQPDTHDRVPPQVGTLLRSLAATTLSSGGGEIGGYTCGVGVSLDNNHFQTANTGFGGGSAFGVVIEIVVSIFNRVNLIRNDDEAILANNMQRPRPHLHRRHKNIHANESHSSPPPPPKHRGYDTTNRFPEDNTGGVPPLLDASSTNRDWSEIIAIISTIPTFPSDADTHAEEMGVLSNTKFSSYVTNCVKKAFRSDHRPSSTGGNSSNNNSNNSKHAALDKTAPKNKLKIPSMSQIEASMRILMTSGCAICPDPFRGDGTSKRNPNYTETGARRVFTEDDDVECAKEFFSSLYPQFDSLAVQNSNLADALTSIDSRTAGTGNSMSNTPSFGWGGVPGFSLYNSFGDFGTTRNISSPERLNPNGGIGAYGPLKARGIADTILARSGAALTTGVRILRMIVFAGKTSTPLPPPSMSERSQQLFDVLTTHVTKFTPPTGTTNPESVQTLGITAPVFGMIVRGAAPPSRVGKGAFVSRASLHNTVIASSKNELEGVETSANNQIVCSLATNSMNSTTSRLLSNSLYPDEFHDVFWSESLTSGLTSTNAEGFPQNLFRSGSCAHLIVLGKISQPSDDDEGLSSSGGGSSQLSVKCESVVSNFGFGGDSIVTMAGVGCPANFRVVEEFGPDQVKRLASSGGGNSPHQQQQNRTPIGLSSTYLNSVRLIERRCPPAYGGKSGLDEMEVENRLKGGFRDTPSVVEFGQVTLRAPSTSSKENGGKGGRKEQRIDREKSLAASLREFSESQSQNVTSEDAINISGGRGGSGYQAIELARVLMPRENMNLSFYEFDPFGSLGPLVVTANYTTSQTLPSTAPALVNNFNKNKVAAAAAASASKSAANSTSTAIFNAANMLFLSSSSKSQITAMRSLAEMPNNSAGSDEDAKLLGGWLDINFKDLPCMVLSDCLRGDPAHRLGVHSASVRRIAAECVGQWQLNKGGESCEKTNVRFNEAFYSRAFHGEGGLVGNDVLFSAFDHSVGEGWAGARGLFRYLEERAIGRGKNDNGGGGNGSAGINGKSGSNSDAELEVLPVRYLNEVVWVNSNVNASKKKRKVDGSSGNRSRTSPVSITQFDDDDEANSGVGIVRGGKWLDAHDDAVVGKKRRLGDGNSGNARNAGANVNRVPAMDGTKKHFSFSREFIVRRQVLHTVGAIRAKDHQTPYAIIVLLEKFLASAAKSGGVTDGGGNAADGGPLNQNRYDESICEYATVVAGAYVNINYHATDRDDGTGKIVKGKNLHHPVDNLLRLTAERLEWETWKLGVGNRRRCEFTDGVVSAGCIFASWRMGLLRRVGCDDYSGGGEVVKKMGETNFYKKVLEKFSEDPNGCDRVALAAAQAVVSCSCFKAGVEKSASSLALLDSMSFLLDIALRDGVSNRLRQGLIETCLDACTGKAATLNRVGGLSTSGESFGVFPLDARDVSIYNNGPLGGTFGHDNSGSGLPLCAGEKENPVAYYVNEGVKRGLGILKNRQPDFKSVGDKLEKVLVCARFASLIWRSFFGGVLVHDSCSRGAMLALNECLWPKHVFKNGCPSIIAASRNLRMRKVDDNSIISVEEKDLKTAKNFMMHERVTSVEKFLEGEIEEQKWRSEMVSVQHSMSVANNVDTSDLSNGEGSSWGRFLEVIRRDDNWKRGGWANSTAKQRSGDNGESSDGKVAGSEKKHFVKLSVK